MVFDLVIFPVILQYPMMDSQHPISCSILLHSAEETFIPRPGLSDLQVGRQSTRTPGTSLYTYIRTPGTPLPETNFNE